MVTRKRTFNLFAGLLATAVVAMFGPAGVVSATPAFADVGPEYLSGQWLGSTPADTGGCGTSVTEYAFDQTTWAQTTNTTDCGGFTLYGQYTVAGDGVLDFVLTGCSAACGSQVGMEWYEYFNLPDANTLVQCDYPSGMNCFTDFRQ